MYDTSAIPTTSYENLSPEGLLRLSGLWEELKSDVSVSGVIYVLCAVILAIIIGGGSFLAIRKRLRDRY